MTHTSDICGMGGSVIRIQLLCVTNYDSDTMGQSSSTHCAPLWGVSPPDPVVINLVCNRDGTISPTLLFIHTDVVILSRD